MKPDITEDAVMAILGENSDKFTFNTSSTGNIQINIKSLGQTGTYQQVSLLKSAADALVKAGYTDDPNTLIRLSYRVEEDGRERWVPYPCIWVNKPSQTQQEIANLRSDNAEMKAALQKLLAHNTAESTTENEASEPKF